MKKMLAGVALAGSLFGCSAPGAALIGGGIGLCGGPTIGSIYVEALNEPQTTRQAHVITGIACGVGAALIASGIIAGNLDPDEEREDDSWIVRELADHESRMDAHDRYLRSIKEQADDISDSMTSSISIDLPLK